MRHFLLSLLCLALIAPASAVAQTNIKKAFDKLIESKNAELTETNKSERDPATGDLEAMSDVIDFAIPEKDFDLIRNIESAFKQDSPKSYHCYSGAKGYSGGENMSLSTGANTSVNIIKHPGSNYNCALFLDPKKSDKYRYAYSLSYVKQGKEYKGRLVICYSTTLKYRQEQANRPGNGNKKSSASKKWIEGFLEQIAVLESCKNSETSLTYALSEIYKTCSNAPESIDSRDKKLAYTILTEKLTNSHFSPTNHAVLAACVECMK